MHECGPGPGAAKKQTRRGIWRFVALNLGPSIEKPKTEDYRGARCPKCFGYAAVHTLHVKELWAGARRKDEVYVRIPTNAFFLYMK
jgi:hypothetical protein